MLKALPLLAASVFAAGSAYADGPSGRLVITTSFPNDMTAPFQKAFQEAYPNVRVEIQNRNTNAGVSYLRETASNNVTDIFWSSAPDAFEVLKADGLLAAYAPKVEGIPAEVSGYPIHDPDGYYAGFALSGYGIMFNERYLQANKLPAPKEWGDLARPEYYDHVAMAAPSRSGTTHLTVETILQGDGWEKGWRTLKELSGNFRTVTERSFGVPDGVNTGDFGLGIVIDFFGLSSQASGFPVGFVYPTVTTLVPANVGIVNNAPNLTAAEAFVDFLLSEQGQAVLLEPSISRLPVNPATYAKAPADYPNPFKDQSIGAAVNFDSQLSLSRFAVVDALFDQTITFLLDDLKVATKAIHEAEARLAKKPGNDKAKALIAEARDLIAAMPITAEEASSAEVVGAFTVRRRSQKDEVPQRQAALEQQWSSSARDNYRQARARANEAARLLR
ncbi:MAG TPA: extracellular solute-binding protein [Gammaproteobacteria bacterium]|nr:extracellular solute-binding protein [Gammaproteobacteria bacterium]